MIELESVREVRADETRLTLIALRESVCNASAALPVVGFQALHNHLGRTSEILTGYIEVFSERAAMSG